MGMGPGLHEGWVKFFLGEFVARSQEEVSSLVGETEFPVTWLGRRSQPKDRGLGRTCSPGLGIVTFSL